ncbi:MAG: DUF2231 domain-containing protein [Frankiaceae bacterium]
MPATVFGVPTHPLTVHAAVVLVPLAVIAVVVAALWPAARRRYGPVVLILATFALLSVPVAKESGESLARRLPDTPLIQQHEAMSDGLLPWVTGLWIAAVAVVVLPWVWSLANSAQAATTDRGASVPPVSAGAPVDRGKALDDPVPMPTGPEPLLQGPDPAGARGGRLVSRLAGWVSSRAAGRIAAASSWRRGIGVAAAALAVVTAVGSTAEIVRIGHSGAKAVWTGTPAATR